MARGLLLVGHGSRRNPHSRDAVCEQAARLRQRSAFDQVGVGFLKEEPGLASALHAMASDQVIVVPMFASTGYYTEEVIPRELRLQGAVTVRGGQTIHYRSPVGSHPGVAGIIIDRARQAGADSTAGVVVLGHGTPRNTNSEKNIYAQVERVREHHVFAEVCAAFIDQDPTMDTVWARTIAEELVLVPLFMAAGWHVRETIPEDVSVNEGVVRHGERTLRISEPVGTHPGIAGLVLSLAGPPGD